MPLVGALYSEGSSGMGAVFSSAEVVAELVVNAVGDHRLSSIDSCRFPRIDSGGRCRMPLCCAFG